MTLSPPENRSETTPLSTDLEVVTGAVVRDILIGCRLEIFDVVHRAYLAHGTGETVDPDSYFLRFPDKPNSRIIALPGVLGEGADRVIGLKWISSFPDNTLTGSPRASAVLVLNDRTTGRPFALLEAAGISAARTAASAVVTASAIARSLEKKRGSVAILGAGVIARTILDYLVAAEYDIEHLVVHDLDHESGRLLVNHARGLGIARASTGTLEEALTAGTIVAATTALAPYAAPTFKAGQIVLNVSLRDFAPESLLGADNVVDDIDHCLKADTSPHLVEKLTGSRNFVNSTIPDVLAGRWEPSGTRPVVVSPFGLGVLDLAVGAFVLERARTSGRVHQVPDFVGEVDRW